MARCVVCKLVTQNDAATLELHAQSHSTGGGISNLGGSIKTADGATMTAVELIATLNRRPSQINDSAAIQEQRNTVRGWTAHLEHILAGGVQTADQELFWMARALTTSQPQRRP